MNHSTINKALLWSFFAGQASPLQKKLIVDWLKTERNQELYFEWLEEYQHAFPQYVADVEAPLLQLQSFMQAQPSALASDLPTGITTHRLISPRWFWAAASFLMILGISAWLGKDHILNQTISTGVGETKTFELPDGSQVTLNAKSTLRYPRFGFGKQNREIQLQGEAFFKVQHTKSHQLFVVKTQRDFDVEVLGTEFTVSTSARHANVLLKNGKVNLRFKENPGVKELSMKPGDLVTIAPHQQPQLKKHVDTKNLMAWTEKEFVFNQMNLQEVCQLIQTNFGTQITIRDPSLATRTVSGTFQTNNSEELLLILSEMFNFSYAKAGNQVLISEQSQ